MKHLITASALLSLVFLSTAAVQAQQKSIWDELTARGSKFIQQQNMAAAEPLMIQALQEAKKNPANQVRLVKSNENLGWLYYRQGKYLQAQPYLRQVLSIAEKSKDPEIIQAGVVVVETLAFIDLQQGKYREAESLYTRLAGATITIPELNPLVKISGLLGRTNVLATEGRYTEAKQLLQQSQSAVSKFAPPPVPTGQPRDKAELVKMLRQAIMSGFLTAMKHRLDFDQKVAEGNVLLAEGNLDQAEAAFRHGCDQLKRDFKKEVPAIILGYMGLGRACLQRGKLSDAQDYFQKSKVILERESVQERPFVEACQIQIADILTRKEKYSEALTNLTAAKSSLEKNMGAETVPVSDCWVGLGNIARATGKTEEAEADYRKALAIKEKLFGKDSEKLGSALTPLADLMEKSGKEDDAKQLYAQCVNAYEKRSLAGNVQACKAMIGQGNLERKNGNTEKAEQLYRNALPALERNLLPSDQVLLEAYRNLGDIYISQSKWPEAETMFRREVVGIDRLARKDEALAYALNGLGAAEFGQQKWSDAQTFFSRLLDLLEANPSFQAKAGTALKDYPEVLKKLNRESESEQVASRIQRMNFGSKTAEDNSATKKADPPPAAHPATK